MLCGQATLGKRASHLVLRKCRKLVPYLLNTCGCNRLIHLLLKIPNFQIISKCNTSWKRLYQPKNTLKQCRLSDAVCTGKNNLLSSFHLKVESRWKRIIIANDQSICLENIPPRSTRCLKVKLRLWLFSSKLNNIHLVKLLLTWHRHIPCSDTRLISRHKILQLFNLLLLFVVRSLKLGFLHLIDFHKLVIIPDIPVELLVVHVIDEIYHAV